MDHPSPSSPSSGLVPLNIFTLDDSFDLQAALHMAFLSEAEAWAADNPAADLDQPTHGGFIPTPPFAPQPSSLSSSTPPFQPHPSSQQPQKVLFTAKTRPTGSVQHNQKRQQRRRQKASAFPPASISKVPRVQLCHNMIKKHSNLTAHQSDFNALDLSHTKGGWTSIRYQPSAQEEARESLVGLLAEGYKYISVDDSYSAPG
ncbi:hypothetical protein H4582DRAFT_2086556 [Lactarius indigo]|nr:hypothetical protein H4582DRAFT_2086556 [Lactarius indigo]